MERNWTEDQKRVIASRGRDLLVSAAAGAGKTAVLVERIVQRVTDRNDPVDIDQLLVVTFTNAAAGEMKERIRARLQSALKQDPENTHLQRQAALVHTARITTIHSFCAEVIRSHYHMIDLPPDLRVAEESEIDLVKAQVLQTVLETIQAPAFRTAFASGKDDTALGKVILQCYAFGESEPMPKRWRQQLMKHYQVKDKDDLNQSPWMMALMEQVHQSGLDSIRLLKRALDLTSAPGGPRGYAPALQEDLSRFTEAFHTPARDYDSLRAGVRRAMDFGPIGRISKKEEVDPDLKETVKALRDEVKSDWKRRWETQLYGESGAICDMLLAGRETLAQLVEVTELFARLFAEKKRDLGIMDFSDMEHFALQILVREEEGEYRPTEAALEYARQFVEVMTDEYQDSNLVQEMILQSVSGWEDGRRNRFMVGDVKQSIYRFRQARPELFMEKYRSYPLDLGAERIILKQNFRSRPQVLEAVNMVFRQIMAPDVGEVAYDDEAALYPGAVYPDGEIQDLQPELLLLSIPETDPLAVENQRATDPEAGDGSSAWAPENGDLGEETSLGSDLIWQMDPEAQMVGRRILEMTREANPFQVQGSEGKLRSVRYEDMVILLRSGRTLAGAYLQTLTQMGIPVYAGGGVGYFETPEVRTVLAALEILDNPHQDIPLAAVMRSVMGGFDDEDLALIKAGAPKEADFYEACRHMSTIKDRWDPRDLARRVGRFLATVDALREEAVFTPVHDMIWRILDVTGYGYAVEAMPAGAQRSANLRLLVEKAVAYEQTSYRGVFHFLRYIRQIHQLEGDAAEASVLPEGANVVRIMTIHKSKGLEFPVVFVGGLGRRINQMDARTPLMMHPTLGVGFPYVDAAAHVKVSPVIRSFLASHLVTETLGEELRVLYVAMTRAREKLVLAGTVKQLSKAFRRWENTAQLQGDVLPWQLRSRAGTYLELLMPALLRHQSAEAFASSYGTLREAAFRERRAYLDGVGFSIRVCGPAEEETALPARQVKLTDFMQQLDPSVIYDARVHAWLQTLRAHADTPMPAQIPVKMTVSELKHRSYEEAVREQEFGEANGAFIPHLEQPREEIGGAYLGTLYHQVFEHLDYEDWRRAEAEGVSPTDFGRMLLERLTECGKIQAEEAAAISPNKVAGFLCSPIGRRMCLAQKQGLLHRETPFVLGVRAADVDPSWNPSEQVLLQGIIDAWFYEQDQIVLVDYKTDYVDEAADASGQVLVRRYAVQLEWYAQALARLTGRKVKEKLIYSVTLEREITV